MGARQQGARRWAATLVVAFATTAMPALAQADETEDMTVEVMIGACNYCHGTDGNGVGEAIPNIAGMPDEQFIYMMTTYQDESNPSTVMGRVARGYTEDQIEAMAAYYGAKPFERPPQPWIDETLVAEGKKLAAEYCESCHENEGRDGEGVGILAGQKLRYMHFSVDDFLSGAREMERRQARKFRELMDDHGEEGFEKILNYYASVQ